MKIGSFFIPAILALSFTPNAIAAAQEQTLEDLAPEPAGFVQPASDVGRYRLFDGQLNVVTLKGPDLPERLLLKIDTVTGQTWIGKQVQYLDKKGKVIQQRYWEPFEQYLESPPTAPQAR